MAKLKAPLLSFKASNTLAKTLTFQKKGNLTIVRTKPTPTDPHTNYQLWHRFLYRQAAQYWQGLTLTQKKEWETNARPFHMTGFALFMRYRLNELPYLKGCWPLDENTGTITMDYSSHKNHGTLVGPSWTTGLFNSALAFDGIDDYVKCGNAPSLNPLNQITVEAFIRWTDWGATYQAIMSKGRNTTSWTLDLYRPGRVLRFGLKTTVALNTWQPIPILDNTWCHVAGTYDGAQLISYFNGTPSTPVPQTGNIAITTIEVGIGGNTNEPTSYPFKGCIDEPALHSIALPQSTLLIHANRKEAP